ncbi:MAG: hypothetical protein JSW40_03275 [Candidatus Omnitrophota bacterium]|nr:MAG: hypothetical protein JSW40_03275 [Candidatus Omnitrophota bacterium]
MPIHLTELDVIPEAEGLDSALIVACNMCAGASLAMKENKPFMQVFGSFLKSPPLVRYIKRLQFQLREKGIKTKWFKGGVLQQFFLCLSTSRHRKKIQKYAKKYEAVIVLGCDSAIETVRDSVKGTNCNVIVGMEVGGIMNTKPKFHSPCNISFEGSKIIPICDRHCKQAGKMGQRHFLPHHP